MNTTSSQSVSVASNQAESLTRKPDIEQNVDFAVEGLLVSLPDPNQLSSEQRRGIIARYTAVLEGNFIYWMTAAYLSVASEESRSIILGNLREEVRDSHPRMLREFALAAHAIPTDSDAIAVDWALTKVRLFMGRLSGVRIVIAMAFFEGFIQRFMPYLAELGAAQGSAECEYTEVHGICDVAHTKELFDALAAEMAIDLPAPSANLFEGVDLLQTLIRTVIAPTVSGDLALPNRTDSLKRSFSNVTMRVSDSVSSGN